MTDAETVKVVKNGAASRFEVHAEGHVAFADYRPIEGGVAFTHTEVPEALGGRGIATRLVEAGLKDARDNSLLVVPQCSVFARYMKRHPETHDLIHPSARAALGIDQD